MTDIRLQTSDFSSPSPLAPRPPPRGVTLMELVLASVLGLVVVLAVGQTDVSRILMTNHVRGFAVAQMEAAFALSHMSKQLEGADRLVRLSATHLRFRVPLRPPLDTASNYVWKEYTYDSANRIICFYEPVTASGCTLASRFQDVDGLTFTRPDNLANVVEIAVETTIPTTGSTTYQSRIMIRGSSSTLSTGLARDDVAPLPPAACPASCPVSS